MKALGALFLLPAAALAAPPPGHPTPNEAGRLLAIPRSAELPFQGRVTRAMDSNQYTFIEVEDGNRSRWLAAPRTALQPGQTIRYGDGVVMRNFYSKVHRITFEEILFVNEVAVGLDSARPASSGSAAPPAGEGARP